MCPTTTANESNVVDQVEASHDGGVSAGEEQSLLREGPQPLHDQIAEWIRGRIVSGTWPAHYKLPAEPALASSFAVSRGTVRRALQTLIDEGLLVQVQGKGTFVTSGSFESPIAQDLLSLAEALRLQGLEFATAVRAAGVTEPSELIRGLLGLPPGATVFRLERVRSVAGTPVALLVNYVRLDLCPGIDERDFAGKTLFGVIEQEYGLRIGSGRRTFEAQAAAAETAEALEVAEGTPLLYLEQVTYSADGTPIEYSDVWIRGDQLRLSAFLTRTSINV